MTPGVVMELIPRGGTRMMGSEHVAVMAKSKKSAQSLIEKELSVEPHPSASKKRMPALYQTRPKPLRDLGDDRVHGHVVGGEQVGLSMNATLRHDRHTAF